MNFFEVTIKVSSPSNTLFQREPSIGNFLKGIISQHINLMILLQLPVLSVKRLPNIERAGVHTGCSPLPGSWNNRRSVHFYQLMKTTMIL